MSFGDLLRARLGPLADIVAAPRGALELGIDPAALWYRRALGLELSLHPGRREVQLRAPHHADKAVSAARARAVGGMTTWRSAGQLAAEGWSPSQLWEAVEAGQLYFSRNLPPGGTCAGQPGALGRAAEQGLPIARRAAVWATPAVETATEVAPMRFMPRGRDLEGAELVGLRMSSLERGHEVFAAQLLGGAGAGALLRALWPRLSGAYTEAALIEGLSPAQREAARRLLIELDAFGLLEARPPSELASKLAKPAGPQLTWLGHAGVLLQDAGQSLLVDPVFFAPSDPPAPWDRAPRFDPRALPEIDAVLITHGDNDHLNPNSLVQLPPETPVYIPKVGRYPKPFQVDMRGQLSVLGFTRVVELEPWQVVALGGLELTACPFVGEDWGLPLAQLTYLVEGPGLSAYFSADCCEMPEVYDALGARARRIDVAFMGISGNAEAMLAPPELGYGNFYADWIPAAQRGEWVQHCAGPAQAAAALARFRPRFAFGYAGGGAPYIRTAYSDTGDHAQLAERLRAEGQQTRPRAFQLGEPTELVNLD